MNLVLDNWNEEVYSKFIEYLLSFKTESLKEFNNSIYNEKEKIVIGIKIPVLREISKEILKGNSKSFIEFSQKKNTYVEEVIIQGFVIALRKEDIKEKLNNIDRFIPKITNWAICDSFVPALKCIKKYRKEWLEYIYKYFDLNNEFSTRFYIVSLLDYYIEDDTIDFVLNTLKNISSDKYYIQMAVAWTICEAYIYYPEKVENIFKENNLDKFTINKAISKINDSYRVNRENKEYIKKYRVK